MTMPVPDRASGLLSRSLFTLVVFALLIWATATLALFAQFHFYFGSPAEKSWRWAVGDGFVWLVVIALCYLAYRAISSTGRTRLNMPSIVIGAVFMGVIGHPVLSVLLQWMLDGTLGRGFVGDTTHLILKRLPQGIAIGSAIAGMAILSLRQATAKPVAEEREHFTFRDGSTQYQIPLEQIELLEAAGNYVAVHHGGQSPLARITLTALLHQLPSGRFIRVSRKHAVGLLHVRALDRTKSRAFQVVLASGVAVLVSRSRTSAIKNALSDDL